MDPRHDYSQNPLREPQAGSRHTALCPQCEGHGGWIEHVLDEKRMGGIRTAYTYSYFCYQCYGWGYVDPASPSATCVHEFEEISRPSGSRSGIHVDRCKLCGHKQSRDTSD